MSGKRLDYLSWDQYFMGVALLSAQRSKDPNTQVGPCNECAKAIIQSDVSEVVFLSDKHRDSDSDRASRMLLDMAGVQVRRFTEELEITLVATPCP